MKLNELFPIVRENVLTVRIMLNDSPESAIGGLTINGSKVTHYGVLPLSILMDYEVIRIEATNKGYLKVFVKA